MSRCLGRRLQGPGGPILDELTERDHQTLFELCARLATRHQVASSRQAVSQHLDLLVDAGLVKTRREGRYELHHSDRRPLERLADHWLQGHPEDR
jgi:DNA-binding transcriptional ArsR family regulator